MNEPVTQKQLNEFEDKIRHELARMESMLLARLSAVETGHCNKVFDEIVKRLQQHVGGEERAEFTYPDAPYGNEQKQISERDAAA